MNHDEEGDYDDFNSRGTLLLTSGERDGSFGDSTNATSGERNGSFGESTIVTSGEGDGSFGDSTNDTNGMLVTTTHSFRAGDSIVNSNVLPPMKGMTFSTVDEAENFLKNYGYQIGFSVVKNGGGSSGHKRKPRTLFKCFKHDKPQHSSERPVNERNRLIVKDSCKFSISLLFDAAKEWWFISTAKLDHTHEVCPEYSHKLAGFRELKDHVKKQLEANHNAGVPVNGNINAVTQMAGGSEFCGFTERDARNYLDSLRRVQFKNGDAEALMRYFRDKQSADPNFFYRVKFDEENRLERVFWSDSICRASYKYFGDVVSFDTTYIVNK